MPPAHARLFQVWPLPNNQHQQNQQKITKGLVAGYASLLQYVEDHPAADRGVVAVPTLNQVDGGYLDQILDEQNRRNLRRKKWTTLTDAEFPGVEIELHLMTAANQLENFTGPILAVDPTSRLLGRIQERHGDPELIVVGFVPGELQDWVNAAHPDVIDVAGLPN